MTTLPSPSHRYFRPGDRFLLIFLAFLGAFPPITTDMYLPALPAMGANLHIGNELATITISAFLLIFALSMLFWGPMSDKYGRKPILVIGLVLFIFSSMAIAISDSFWNVLFWRCVEACGSGAACAMSLAIVKDVFRGRLMEKVVSLIQASTVLAPMIAPVLGGLLIYFTNWRGIFWALTVCGILAMLVCLMLRETAGCYEQPTKDSSLSRLFTVLRYRPFLYPLLLFSSLAMPFMSYLAVSSFIFQNMFHVSPQMFSLFFSLNAGASILGPLLHLKYLARLDRKKVISWEMALMSTSGILLALFGHLGPWQFTLLFMPITICGSAIRPPSTVLLMNCLKEATGTVSSLINCGGLLFGSFSMFLASADFWPNPVIATATISFIVGTLALLCWRKLAK